MVTWVTTLGGREKNALTTSSDSAKLSVCRTERSTVSFAVKGKEDNVTCERGCYWSTLPAVWDVGSEADGVGPRMREGGAAFMKRTNTRTPHRGSSYLFCLFLVCQVWPVGVEVLGFRVERTGNKS